MFGFGGSDDIKVDTGELDSASITIYSVYEILAVSEGDVMDLTSDEVDDVPGAGDVVMDAVNSFNSAWVASRGALLDNLFSLQERTVDIAADVENFDDIMSSGLNGLSDTIEAAQAE
ncbi:hypothetical protein [Corynebacterium cystitidis]|uniref:hypothetical protein n=1 Tax=Corynebacterium cystitidis TaxID=35757 RepID=UPI00211E9ABE|nr:hypothetical protein [Corynebacterium cystitidis]